MENLWCIWWPWDLWCGQRDGCWALVLQSKICARARVLKKLKRNMAHTWFSLEIQAAYEITSYKHRYPQPGHGAARHLIVSVTGWHNGIAEGHAEMGSGNFLVQILKCFLQVKCVSLRNNSTSQAVLTTWARLDTLRSLTPSRIWNVIRHPIRDYLTMSSREFMYSSGLTYSRSPLGWSSSTSSGLWS